MPNQNPLAILVWLIVFIVVIWALVKVVEVLAGT